MAREGIDFLTTSMQALGLRVIPSQANFVTFCLAGNARPVYEGLLRYGVIVRHLASFGMERCIRVTVGTEPQNLRFLNALRAVIEEIGGD
jgi:histidinol-phosphate aminotransferase